MSFLAFPKEAICDRSLVSSQFSAAIHLFLSKEPDYLQLINAAKEGSNAMALINKLYEIIVDGEIFDGDASSWFKRSCKLSYDSGLFGISTKGRREFYFDVQRNL